MTSSSRPAPPNENWVAEGFFVGADGRLVRRYDDVILSRPIKVEGGSGHNLTEVPAGTIATVLFFSTGPVGYADLECYTGGGGFAFGFETISQLKLFRKYEEKDHGKVPELNP